MCVNVKNKGDQRITSEATLFESSVYHMEMELAEPTWKKTVNRRGVEPWKHEKRKVSEANTGINNVDKEINTKEKQINKSS